MFEYSGLFLILIGLLLIFAVLAKKFLSQNAKSTTEEEDDMYFQELQRQQNLKKQNQSSSNGQNNKDDQSTKKELLIFFGSQTGCAEKLSYLLQSEAEEHEIEAKVIDLEEFEDEVDWKTPFYGVFFIATHGEGESTDNSKPFLKWIKKEGNKNNTLLKDLKFSVFGLGNSSYQHYCAIGKQLNTDLEKYGGKRFYKFGIGDDLLRGQQEQDFNEWKTDFWPTLKKCFNPELEIVDIQKNELKQNKKKQSKKDYSIVITQEPEIDFIKYDYKQDPDKDYEFQTKQYLESQLSEVVNVYELRQNKNDGSTLHLIFDLKNTSLQYETAQNLYIFPHNDNLLVQDLASFLNIDLNQNIKLVSENKKARLPFPSPISVKRVLTEFCDFQGSVMKKTLKDLANLTDNPIIQKKLEFLASTEGKDDYNQLVEDHKITLFQLLQIYNIRPTLEQFIQLTFRITPRAYTISSSKLMHPSEVHISCSLDFDTLPDNKIKVGLASQYFQYLQHQIKYNKMKVRINFKSSNFILPSDKNLPIVMVGPGAGITPFRAFLQENQYLVQTGQDIYNNMILYFGCRHKDGDFIFQDELKQFLDKKLLKKLYLAFSRDQNQKYYVQDLIKNNSNEMYDLIENQAIIYLCGNVKMGKDVQEILENIVSDKRNISKEESKNFILDLEKNKRFIKELW